MNWKKTKFGKNPERNREKKNIYNELKLIQFQLQKLFLHETQKAR